MEKIGFFANVFSFTPQSKEEIQIIKVSIDQKTGEQIIAAKVNGKEVNLREFNINDNRPRKVVCISGKNGCVKGNLYNLTHVDVHTCVTYLTLKENDYTRHNSVNFAELPAPE